VLALLAEPEILVLLVLAAEAVAVLLPVALVVPVLLS